MGVEAVLHEANLRALRVAGGQLLHELGVFALGALGTDLLQALPGQGLDGGQHAATAVLRIGIVLLGYLAGLAGLGGLRGQALDHVTEQKAGALIEADHRKLRVVGPGVEREQRFEALQVLPVDLPDAPLAL